MYLVEKNLTFFWWSYENLDMANIDHFFFETIYDPLIMTNMLKFLFVFRFFLEQTASFINELLFYLNVKTFN